MCNDLVPSAAAYMVVRSSYMRVRFFLPYGSMFDAQVFIRQVWFVIQ